MIILPLQIVEDVEELAARLSTYAAFNSTRHTDIDTKRDAELERRMILRP